MPFPRMTMRRWMIAVAVVGAAMSLGARRASFQRRAYFYWTKLEPGCGFYHAETPAEMAEARKQSHYADLWLKYDRAARRPWLPVPPDPPEPE